MNHQQRKIYIKPPQGVQASTGSSTQRLIKPINIHTVMLDYCIKNTLAPNGSYSGYSLIGSKLITQKLNEQITDQQSQGG